jgi:hypothetical protein
MTYGWLHLVALVRGVLTLARHLEASARVPRQLPGCCCLATWLVAASG